MRSCALVLPALRSSPKEARNFAKRMVRLWRLDHLTEPVELIVSELVTNAVVHAKSDVRVWLRCVNGRRLRVEVSDASHKKIRRRLPMASDPSGRGLWIVSRMADRWGTDTAAEGKTVWVELVTKPAEAS